MTSGTRDRSKTFTDFFFWGGGGGKNLLSIGFVSKVESAQKVLGSLQVVFQGNHECIKFAVQCFGLFSEDIMKTTGRLRPVYTGDLCGDLCGDFKRDFAACKLLTIQIAAESPVVFTGGLKSP